MGSGAVRHIVVEVVYAEPGRQTLIELEVPEGTTVAQAIALSGIGATHSDVDVAEMKTGIFGTLASPDAVLRERDRVEIYRPLRVDPKEVRRRRAGSKAGKKKD